MFCGGLLGVFVVRVRCLVFVGEGVSSVWRGAWCSGRWVLWGCGAGLVKFGWVEVVGRGWWGA